MNASFFVVFALAAATALTACATGPLRPEHWLVWRVADFHSEQVADEVRWSYSFVLENRGTRAAHILRGFATVSLGSVRASPDEIVAGRTIAAGEVARASHSPVFRSSAFNDAALSDRKAVKWQFWGKYEDGELIILSAEVAP